MLRHRYKVRTFETPSSSSGLAHSLGAQPPGAGCGGPLSVRVVRICARLERVGAR